MAHIHFVGIGGAGLSALAKVMLAQGYTVSGSDTTSGPLTDALAKQGATIFVGQRAENIKGADWVVVTSAAPEHNPEIVAARALKIPVLKRREFLSKVTAGYDTIAVAGSHGKTTTTALIATIFEAAGLDPTVVVGGVLPDWGTNARTGASRWFVIEADEYDYAFWGLTPLITVVTNVDYDHPDLFATREAYRETFAKFLAQTRNEGVIIACGDDASAKTLAEASGRTVRRYGLGATNEWSAQDVRVNAAGGNDFAVYHGKEAIGKVSLAIPGKHNVLNALAATVVAERAEIPFPKTADALRQFKGVGRRFQVRGSFHGAVLIDDYAHHPTEIRASIRAARERYPQARLWVLFQPHTFSRTAALLDDFAEALDQADRVIVTEIFAAREQDTQGMTGRLVVEHMKLSRGQFVESLAQAQLILQNELRPGDVLLALGAGDIPQVAGNLAAMDRQ